MKNIFELNISLNNIEKENSDIISNDVKKLLSFVTTFGCNIDIKDIYSILSNGDISNLKPFINFIIFGQVLMLEKLYAKKMINNSEKLIYRKGKSRDILRNSIKQILLENKNKMTPKDIIEILIKKIEYYGIDEEKFKDIIYNVLSLEKIYAEPMFKQYYRGFYGI